MESRRDQRTQNPVSHFFKGNKEKLNMKVSDQTRSQAPHRVHHTRSQLCRSLSPAGDNMRSHLYQSHSPKREHCQSSQLPRSQSSGRGHFEKSQLYPSRSPERDHYKRSQFSPSHSPQRDIVRDHNDKSHPPERDQYERSQLSRSSSPVLRECCRNPKPRFVPNLPSRPRKRGALPSFLPVDTRTVPVLPRNISCSGDTGKMVPQGEENDSFVRESVVPANQRNTCCTVYGSKKICKEEDILSLEDQATFIPPQGTFAESIERNNISDLTVKKYPESCKEGLLIPPEHTQLTSDKALSVNPAESLTSLQQHQVSSLSAKPGNDLPMNTMEEQIMQTLQKEVEQRNEKISSTQEHFQIPLHSDRMCTLSVKATEYPLLKPVLQSDSIDTSALSVRGQTVQKQVSYEDPLLQSSEISSEERQENRDGYLQSMSQKDNISGLDVRRHSETENMSQLLVKQFPKTWNRNGGTDKFCRNTTLPSIQEQFYRPRQRSNMRGQSRELQESQETEVPYHLRFPYGSEELQVLSALHYSKRAFLGICTELESAVRADERMYNQMEKELETSFSEVKLAKEAVLKDRDHMESVKRRALEDPLAMSRQITKMKEVRVGLEDVNTDLSVQLAELNQLREQLEEQQRILDVLRKLKPDQDSCNNDEDEFLLNKQEECKAKLLRIESELNESRKMTNKLEEISSKRMEDLNELNIHTCEGKHYVEERVWETRPSKRQTYSEEQLMPKKQPKLEYEN